MRTIKLSIQISNDDKSFIETFQRQYSSAIHWFYNRILEENLSTSQMEQNIKQLNNVDLLDSWFIRCARIKADLIRKSVIELNKTRKEDNQINLKKVIFGTKYKFYQRLIGKISKEEYKKNRLSLINCQGEIHQNGNRKFEFDINNNRIIFKPFSGKKILLTLPKLRKSLYKILKNIQERHTLYSVELSTEYIHISFNETDIEKHESRSIPRRILGIDLNPNYIGYSISDFDKQGNQSIIVKKCYDLTKLTENLDLKSNNPKKIHQNNKREFEIIKIAKDIVRQAIHYQIDKISLEKLKIVTKDHRKGRKFNRLVNNVWNRNLFIKKVKMEANIFGKKVVDVFPMYSSFIGNLQHDCFDPVNSSLEMARRGLIAYVKGSKLFPALSVKDQWKEYLTQDIKDWKSLFEKIRDIRYRVSLEDLEMSSQEFFRIFYKRKRIFLYSFI